MGAGGATLVTAVVILGASLGSADASYDAVSLRGGAESLVAEGDADCSAISRTVSSTMLRSPSISSTTGHGRTPAVSVSDGYSSSYSTSADSVGVSDSVTTTTSGDDPNSCSVSAARGYSCR